MQALMAVLYMGVVVEVTPVPTSVVQCQISANARLNLTRRRYARHGFDPYYITALCLEPGQVIISEWGQT